MKSVQASRKNRAMRTLWLIEWFAISLAVLGAAWLRFLKDPDGHQLFIGTAPMRAVVVGLIITLAMAAFGLYQSHGRHSRTDLLFRLVLSFGFGGVALLVIFYLLPQTYIGRGPLALTLLIGLVAVLSIRLAAQDLLHVEALRQRILVLGAGKNANLINSRMRRK
ncbi:MAG TPA: hypothetical protein VET30_04705, partial [Pseudoxanthomonas sp.]|nr:hypothetical protein [Pseudoxanthomonas sp.]